LFGRIKSIASYLSPTLWTRTLLAFFGVSAKSLTKGLVGSKKALVYRSFWGRSSLYKNVLHVTFFIFSVLIVITGISTRLNAVQTASQTLSSQVSLNPGDIDLLQQGGSIQTVLASTPGVYFTVTQYVVQSGDSVQTIADKFKVSKDTIKWANSQVNYYTEKINPGDTLQVPEVPGVLYEVKDGDTLDSIVSKTSGDKEAVIGVNELEYPDFKVTAGTKILIPDGKLPPPPPPLPQPVYARYPTNYGQSLVSGSGNVNGIPTANPLSNPDCGGYILSRGFLPWHNGVDLARGGGCPIRAVAAGTVTYAGWGTYGEGYNIKIDHGNGVQSHYYHGDGNIWVRSGQQVAQGQDLMYMGCTGNCTGTHLHFGLRINGVIVDPAPYVPY